MNARRRIIQALVAIVIVLAFYAGAAAARAFISNGKTAMLRGTVTAGSRDLTGLLLDFQFTGETDGPRIRLATTIKKNGEFEVVLPRSGPYRVVLRMTKTIPTRTINIDVPSGESKIALAVPDTGVDVVVSGPVPNKGAVQLEYEGPRGPGSGSKAGVLTGTDRVRLIGMDPGEYTISAEGGGRMTKEAVKFLLRLGETTTVLLDLSTPRAAKLIIQDESNGHLLDVQRITSGARNLQRVGRGQYSLDEIAVGRQFHVFQPGYAPLCQLRPSGDAPEVAVALRPNSLPTTIVLSGVETPVGTLESVPGSTCGVSFAQSLSDIRRIPGGIEAKLHLPPGVYSYFPPTVDARAQTFTVPSSTPIMLTAPAECSVCGGTIVVAEPRRK